MIAPETLAWLRDVLDNCGPFSSDRELAAVFVDARVAPWSGDLPEADSRSERIDALIAYLCDCFSAVPTEPADAPPQNALVLFTQVLADRTSPEDACYATLQAVAQKMGDELKPAEITQDQIVVGHIPTVSSIADAALLDQLITNQQTAIRSYRSFAVALVALGLVVAAGSFAVPGVWIAAAIKPWIGMGGLFIASLSVLQFREILSRQEKVGLFATMKNRLAVMQHDAEYRLVSERIDKLVWQVIEQTAVE